MGVPGDLVRLLRDAYEQAPQGNVAVRIHLFGIEHAERSRSGRIGAAIRATPPRSVDAPFVELHERHSTAVLPMSNGAPPAASGTT